MITFQVRNFSQSDIPAIMQLQKDYAQKFPGAKIVPADVYGSPSFQQGEDVFCLFHPNGQLLAYAVVFPVFASNNNNSPHVMWAEVKTSPFIGEFKMIKDELFDHLLKRIKILIKDRGKHPVEITFQYLPIEDPSIQYVISKGAKLESNIYEMECSLKKPIPKIAPPAGICIQPWKMESTPEQAAYVKARNESFPDAPIRLDDWIYFMQSTQWALGSNIAAFEGEQLAGCMTVFWNEVVDPSVGMSEYIFVRPAWRGRKIAPAMISEGLLYLQEHGLQKAHLEVRATNRNAIDLYEVLGYKLVQESGVYIIRL
jgi:ribosomal protein S18 acetylase RimI-like enzyme